MEIDPRPSRVKGNIFLLFFTVLMIILVSEAVLRVSVRYGRSVATVEDLTIYRPSALVGWEHAPNAVAYHGHGDPVPEVAINSHGMRDDEVTLEKPANTKRVLFLGDSFTFGMGVRHEEIFSEVLEKRLNTELTPETGFDYEVLNMGIIGHTTDQQYLLLRERGLDFDPDFVVLNFFVGNDATELRRHSWVWSSNSQLVAVRDIEHLVDENKVLRRIAQKPPYSYLMFFIRERGEVLFSKLGLDRVSDEPTLTWPNFLPEDHPKGDPRLKDFWEQLTRMFALTKALVEKNDIRLVVTAIPLDMQVDRKYWKKHPGVPFGETEFEAALPQDRLDKLLTSQQISYLDLLPTFREQSSLDTYWLRDDPHWTPEGHRVAAHAIFDYLVKAGL